MPSGSGGVRFGSGHAKKVQNRGKRGIGQANKGHHGRNGRALPKRRYQAVPEKQSTIYFDFDTTPMESSVTSPCRQYGG